MRQFLPIKNYQQEEKPHSRIKFWALCKIKFVVGTSDGTEPWRGVSPWCPSGDIPAPHPSALEPAGASSSRAGIGAMGGHSPGMNDVGLRLSSSPGAKQARG